MTSTDASSGAAASVGLQVAGGDLLLRGRFSQWVPLVITNLPDAEQGQATAQILFDVTSNRPGAQTRADRDLFSFTASEVESLGRSAYRLKGQLRADGRARTVEAIMQAPPAHTPFCVITFPIDRARFPGLWAELEERVARTSNDSELRPFAWLRAPELAAA